MAVVIQEDYFQNLSREVRIAEWLKIEYPMIYQLGELTLHNKEQEKKTQDE